MKTYPPFLVILIILGFSSCIKEDIVNDQIDESIRVNNSFSNFKVGDEVFLDAFFFDNLGIKQTVVFNLSTTDPSVVEIDNSTKKITGKSKGNATVTVSTQYAGKRVETPVDINVNEVGSTPSNTTKVGTLIKTSSYASSGDFEITVIAGGIRIKFASNYIADKTLPGFAMFLSNNPNSIVGAKKIDAQGDADGVIYKGAFTMDIMGVGINDYGYLTHWCEPFKIKVGEAEIKNK